MAFLNTSSNYLRITNLRLDHDNNTVFLEFDCYKDSDTRQNPGNFDLITKKNVSITLTNSQVDNIIETMYNKVKTVEPFNSYTDI